jgi:hypothetical protein
MYYMDVVKLFLYSYYSLAYLTMIKAVTELDLGYNQIGDPGAHDLADILQYDGVRTLSLLISYVIIFNFSSRR